MLERRNSDRIGLSKAMVKETNGDYLYSYEAKNLSEEGLFLVNRFCSSMQEPFSKLSFSLPNGVHLKNITARIVREERKGVTKGCAYEFMNLTEAQRMELKRYFSKNLLVGNS
jgi:hypothetical protein